MSREALTVEQTRAMEASADFLSQVTEATTGYIPRADRPEAYNSPDAAAFFARAQMATRTLALGGVHVSLRRHFATGEPEPFPRSFTFDAAFDETPYLGIPVVLEGAVETIWPAKERSKEYHLFRVDQQNGPLHNLGIIVTSAAVDVAFKPDGRDRGWRILNAYDARQASRRLRHVVSRGEDVHFL